jgi:hypothetical protein
MDWIKKYKLKYCSALITSGRNLASFEYVECNITEKEFLSDDAPCIYIHHHPGISSVCKYNVEYDIVELRKQKLENMKKIRKNDNGVKICETYHLNGKLHREDGPAYISWHGDGEKWFEFYYINGIGLSEKEFKVVNRKRKLGNIF